MSVLIRIKPFPTIVFVLLLYAADCASQTCKGSLGDPVVNITFGTGAAQPLPAGVTSYNYSTAACPDDGFYTIASQTNNCFGDTWHTVPQDHTAGDEQGNMMLINASLEPGDFYRQRVTGLCGGTTYEFASWILNVLKTSACNANGNDPNITFTIENASGTLINSYTTGNITESTNPQWQQFGFFFTTPVGVNEVVIRMTNNSVGGCGNDLALDDITFRACGPTIMASSTTSFSNNKLCEGERGRVDLNATVSNQFVSPAYQWQTDRNDGRGWRDITGANRLSFTVNIALVKSPGYQYRLAVAENSNIGLANCRVYSEVLYVRVAENPTADAGPDLVIVEGKPIRLNGQAGGESVRFFWTPATGLDDPNSLTPLANPTQDITYTLNVISDEGCNNSAEDQVFVRVLKKLIVPNTFTPNGDQINDVWNIGGITSYPTRHVKIFNRYGQLVFQREAYQQDWAGTYKGNPLPAGVYYYIIDLGFEGQIIKGAVAIIR